jgi:hypothetical protein
MLNVIFGGTLIQDIAARSVPDRFLEVATERRDRRSGKDRSVAG